MLKHNPAMIEMKIKRPNNKGFTCYFKKVKDVQNFKSFIETIIENAQKEVLGK